MTSMRARSLLLPLLLLLIGALTSALAGVPTSATLTEALRNSVVRFNDTPTGLNAQLELVLSMTRDVLHGTAGRSMGTSGRTRGSSGGELARSLGLEQPRGSIASSWLEWSDMALRLTPTLAEEAPVLAILARRALLAQLLLRWTANAQHVFDPHVTENIVASIQQLYAAHVESAVRRSVIELLHISKSGGTSFGYAASRNRCRMPPGIGKVKGLGDKPRWINRTAFAELTGVRKVMWPLRSNTTVRQSEARDCQHRHELVSGSGYHYVSNEYTLQGGERGVGGTHVCPQVVNVVVLRDPAARLSAHIRYVLPFFRQLLKSKSERGQEQFRELFCSGRPEVWSAIAPVVVDNYMTRSFLGEAGFYTPPGGVGRAHASAASSLLLQFDLVLDLGAGAEAAGLVMGQGLGWNVTLSEMHGRSLESRLHWQDEQAQECKDTGADAFMARQGPDTQLYRVGRVVALLDRLFMALARDVGLQPSAAAASSWPTGSGAAEAGPFRGFPRRQRCGLVGSRASSPAGAGVGLSAVWSSISSFINPRAG